MMDLRMKFICPETTILMAQEKPNRGKTYVLLLSIENNT